MAESLKTIALDLIEFDERNLRSEPTLDIHELADSIAFIGLLEPPVVTKHGDLFKLVAGERRVRACELLVQDGRWNADASIKCIVRTGLSDEQRMAAIIIENMQRVDLTPTEQSNGVIALAVEHGWGEKQIAEALGATQQWVKDRVNIHGLPEHIKAVIGQPGMTVTTAGQLAALPADRLARLTKDDKVPTAYDVENAVSKLKSQQAADKMFAKLRKAGYIVVTEAELKRLMKADISDLDGDDMLIKTKIADATEIKRNYWEKLTVTSIAYQSILNIGRELEADRLTKTDLYVLARNGGYPEWKLGTVCPAPGAENPNTELTEAEAEYERIEEHNNALREEHHTACKLAEARYIEQAKPAEMISIILMSTVNVMRQGFRSFERTAGALDRLGLEHDAVDIDTELSVRQLNHEANFDRLHAYATKNSANLARAAAVIEMVVGHTTFPVDYPGEPDYLEHADEEGYDPFDEGTAA